MVLLLAAHVHQVLTPVFMEQAAVFHVQMDMPMALSVNQFVLLAQLVPTLVLLEKLAALYAHLVLIAQLLQSPSKSAQLVLMLH